MKTKLTFVTIFVLIFSTPVFAFDEDQMNEREILVFCDSVGKIARSAMQAREQGVSKEEALIRLEDGIADSEMVGPKLAKLLRLAVRTAYIKEDMSARQYANLAKSDCLEITRGYR